MGGERVGLEALCRAEGGAGRMQGPARTAGTATATATGKLATLKLRFPFSFSDVAHAGLWDFMSVQDSILSLPDHVCPQGNMKIYTVVSSQYIATVATLAIHRPATDTQTQTHARGHSRQPSAEPESSTPCDVSVAVCAAGPSRDAAIRVSPYPRRGISIWQYRNIV